MFGREIEISRLSRKNLSHGIGVIGQTPCSYQHYLVYATFTFTLLYASGPHQETKKDKNRRHTLTMSVNYQSTNTAVMVMLAIEESVGL